MGDKCLRKTFRALGVTPVLLVAVLSLCPAAQAKPDVLRVGIIGDFSGPYAPTVGPTKPGAEDAWKYINEELGGVDGVKVEPIIKDMGGKVDVGLSQYNELVAMDPKPVFIDTYITPLAAALRERYVEDKVVGFHAGAAAAVYPVGNSYCYYPDYPEMMAVLVKHVKDGWKEKRAPRFGIVTWDTAYGRAILTEEFFSYLKEQGAELVDTQLFGIRDVDIMAQLMSLKSKNVDFVMTNVTAGGALTVKKGLKEMGWKVPVLNTAGEDWGTVRLDPGIFEGDLIALPTRSFDETNSPAIKIIMERFKAANRTEKEKGMFYLLAWQNAVLQHEVLTKLVREKGWDAVNTASIVAALNSGTVFEPLHGLQKIDYSAARRTPRFVRIYQVKGGKLLPISEFLPVPDLRPKQ